MPRVYPSDRRGVTLRRPPSHLDAQMLCWLAFGEHEALTSGISRLQKISFYKENQHPCLEFTPRTVAVSPSAAPHWGAHMFCWLTFGEHEALKTYLKRARILILAHGIPTSTARLYPTESRAITLCRLSMGGSNALLANIWRT